MIISQDVHDYRFRIEAIFDNDQSREAMKQFLSDSQTVEPLLFINDHEQYMKLRLGQNRFEKANEMINKYITVNSECELNLSREVRNKVLQRFSDIQQVEQDEQECPIDLFDKVQQAIFFELKEDSFSRFITSDLFLGHVKKELKKDPSYLSKIGTLKSEVKDSQRQSFCGIDDLKPKNSLGDKVPYITDDDIETAVKYTEANIDSKIWDCAVDKNDHQIYISKNSVGLGSIELTGKQTHSLKMLRYDVYLKVDTEKLVNFFCDSKAIPTLNEHMKKHAFIEYKSELHGVPLPYGVSYIYEQFQYPVMAKREMVLADTFVPRRYNPQTKQFDLYIRVRKSVEHPDYPRPKGLKALKLVRAEVFNMMRCERISEQFSRFSMIFLMDLGGFVKNEIFTKIMKSGGQFFHESMTKKLADAMKAGNFGMRPVNSDGLVDSMDLYLKNRFVPPEQPESE
jgi:hypothetical protein